MYEYANARYKSLAQTLIDADPFTLGHIDASTIEFLTKEEKTPKKVFRIESIREPFVMMTNKCYIITISEVLIEDISQEHMELHMYKVLRQINPENGRLVPPDVIEFSDIIDLFGYDWQDKDTLPSIVDQLEAKTVANTLVPKGDEEKAS
ncbi:MAG: hypothetical protein K0R18_152 [Bacillales bacterium]|jgi:hypothetical protein|nr:hypothetical protein [Bacillales bacterium]